MTSMNSYDASEPRNGSDTRDAPDMQDTLELRGAPAARRVATDLGPDPVHPGASNPSPAAHEEPAPLRPLGELGERPLASDLGVPAVLAHRVVALEAGSAVSPVAVHSWTGTQVSTLLLTPTQAQVWARAGRLTLATAEGDELPFTVLAPEEGATAPLGAHWPLGEPDGRVRRIAAAAAHDVGDVLTFPAWLVRTAHLSGERNKQLARLVNRIRTASPSTAVHYGQTSGHLHARPDQLRPYDHKGLVGHDGWPREL